MTTHTNERGTREVLETTNNGEVYLLFNYLYKGESQNIKSAYHSPRSKKLIQKKIADWIAG